MRRGRPGKRFLLAVIVGQDGIDWWSLARDFAKEPYHLSPYELYHVWPLEMLMAFIDAEVGPGDGGGKKRSLTREEQLEWQNRRRAEKGLPPIPPRERPNPSK